jgi:putative transposase
MSLANVALDQRNRWWERGQGVGASSYQQQAELPGLTAACPAYSELHAHVLQEVILRLAHAFQAFFRRLTAGETPGYPRCPGRGRSTSFTFPEDGHGAVVAGRLLRLSKSGRIHIRLHRPLEGTPKTVTLSREADGYSGCVSCAEAPVQTVPPTGQETGIDLGIEAFATLSDGARIFHPGCYRKAERALKIAQRRVSRRTRGGHRRQQAVTLLAKAHQTVRRPRVDGHHQPALALVRQYDTLSHEELQPATRVRHHQLAKSITDAGWGAFRTIRTIRTILRDQTAGAGRRVMGVHPAETSHRCSGGGAVVHKRLSVRWHSCPACGTSLHRDHHAAKNRARRGRSLQGGAALAASAN